MKIPLSNVRDYITAFKIAQYEEAVEIIRFQIPPEPLLTDLEEYCKLRNILKKYNLDKPKMMWVLGNTVYFASYPEEGFEEEDLKELLTLNFDIGGDYGYDSICRTHWYIRNNTNN